MTTAQNHAVRISGRFRDISSPQIDALAPEVKGVVEYGEVENSDPGEG
jgi:hypothetical protein